MDNVTLAEDDDYLKMCMYSGHDDTVANVLNALDLFEPHCPPFTATVLFELVQGKPSLTMIQSEYDKYDQS